MSGVTNSQQENTLRAWPSFALPAPPNAPAIAYKWTMQTQIGITTEGRDWNGALQPEPVGRRPFPMTRGCSSI